MAVGNSSLVLHIIADDAVLNRVLKKSQNEINTFSRNVEVAGKKNEASFFGRGSKPNQALRGLASGTGLGSAALFGSGAFIGSAISAAAIKKSVDAASNLNEQITKSQQVFGASDKAILKWSQDTAKNIGISQTAALEAAGTFGNLFKAQGFGTAKNSALSRQLVQLASDLASFNNINPAQVLEDLNSAIVGEIEPVRKYGVDLRVARVQQEALAETGKSTAKELTRQELTLARLHILFKDTSSAQGDFKRTSGGLANQQRILTAQTQDLAADLGTLLLPAVDGLVTAINDALGVTLKFTGALKGLAGVKIPAIHIPFFFDFPGGGKVGNIAGKVGRFAGFAAISPVGAVVKTVHDQLVSGAKKTSKADIPKLASEFKDVLGGFTRDAIDESQRAGGFLKLPKFNQAKLLKGLIDNLDFKLSKADLTAAQTDNISFLKQLIHAYKTEIKLGIDVKNANKSLVDTKKQLQQATQEAASTKFSNIIDSLGLGVEKAQLTTSLNDDLARLQDLKAGLLKQIAAGVDVRNAQHQLIAVTGEIAAKQQEIKQQGIDKFMAALQLGVDKAALTKGLNDDLKALEQQAAGIKSQIKAGNDVVNNQSQLLSVMQAIASKKQEIAQKTSDALQAKQFRALGLSSTGEEIVPGLKNLSTRINQTLDKVSSGELSISSKLATRLKAARRLINKEGDALKEATRQKIDEFIKAANGGDAKTKLNGPLTKTTSLNTNAILKGLGLDPAATKELRARLSHFNVAGQALAGTGVTQAAGRFPVPTAGNLIQVDVTLDGQKVAKSVTIHQQKRARSNPPQKRGPAGGI